MWGFPKGSSDCHNCQINAKTSLFVSARKPESNPSTYLHSSCKWFSLCCNSLNVGSVLAQVSHLARVPSNPCVNVMEEKSTVKQVKLVEMLINGCFIFYYILRSVGSHLVEGTKILTPSSQASSHSVIVNSKTIYENTRTKL